MSLLEQLTELALANKERLHEGHYGLCSYMFVKDDKTYVADNTACYYQMENGVPWKSGITGIICSIKHQRRSYINEDRLRTWLEFHVNDPVFGQAILSKDIDWMMEHKLIIADTSAPGNLMVGVLISIRQAWEYYAIVNSYYELRKADINPFLAYNLAHFLYVSDKNYKLQIYCPGHNLFNGNRLTKKHMSNWFNGKLDQPRKPYVEHSAYSGMEYMFNKDFSYADESVLYTWFCSWIKQAMNSAKSSKSNNPFGKAQTRDNAGSYPCDKLNALIKEHEEELIKEMTSV